MDDIGNPTKPQLRAKHGLSIYLETKIKDEVTRILMDTGPAPSLIIGNAEELGINFTQIDTIVLSHGHYDHVGGLIGVLQHVTDSKPVIAHPQIFQSKFAYRPSIKYIGTPYHPSIIETVHGILLLATNPVKIVDGITTTGEIERTTQFETVEGYYTTKNGSFIHDPIVDDQSLIMSITGKGLVIISGCAHAGIINTIRQAQKITGIPQVYAVLGGFHLKNASMDRIEATTQALLNLDPEIVCPCHCTGPEALKLFMTSFESRVQPIRTGDTLRL